MKITRLLTRSFIIIQVGSLSSFIVDSLQECERTSMGGKLGENLFRVANPRSYMRALARACTVIQHTIAPLQALPLTINQMILPFGFHRAN
ncbi:hypothetical protein CY34DRAFT_337852 [Suillus luteus UH-Slu-Lm8-n1]|uniref:Secreted protein n=1 Tax=Suillus luteus UH-Slu-Lm8-n1 TaxID=930992 RepID=A0A0D0B693_9AGAM|nr:hypothetical protein CY34DRAFT_337852 [Suillus luteus UH-Slu-Lm8-n1]